MSASTAQECLSGMAECRCLGILESFHLVRRLNQSALTRNLILIAILSLGGLLTFCGNSSEARCPDGASRA
jgi:hypothetical protein